MIREERNGAFWNAVSLHPEVAPHVWMGIQPVDLSELINRPGVIPYAADHGGFVFVPTDDGYELHTMFTPEGWGREVAEAAREAFTALFLRGARVVRTLEVETNRRSRPPLSHGWRPEGPFTASDLAANVRVWVLTREAWEDSPVRRRICQSLQQPSRH